MERPLRLLLVLVGLASLWRQAESGCSANTKQDVVFVLDASNSVSQHNFQTTKEFIRDIVDKFEIGLNTVRVGLMTFSSGTYATLHLNKYSNKEYIKNTIMRARYTGGGTDIAQALYHTRSYMLQPYRGDRSDAENVVVLLTDGQSTNGYHSTARAAQMLKAAGTRVFAVGVGSNINIAELKAVASDADHVYQTTFGTLGSLVTALAGKVKCEEENKSCDGSNAKLEDEIKKINAEKLSLTRNLDTVRGENKAAKEKNENCDAEIKALTGKYRIMTNNNKDLEESRAAIARLTQENTNLLKKTVTLTEEKGVNLAKMNNMNKELDALKQENKDYDTLKSEKEQLTENIKKLETEKETAITANADLKEANSNLSAKVNKIETADGKFTTLAPSTWDLAKGCSGGYSLVAGMCLKIYRTAQGHIGQETFTVAEALCRQDGARLPVLKTREQIDKFISFVRTTQCPMWWVGAQTHYGTYRAQWSDGTPIAISHDDSDPDQLWSNYGIAQTQGITGSQCLAVYISHGKRTHGLAKIACNASPDKRCVACQL